MPAPKERSTIKAQSERAVLAAVRLPDSNYDARDPFGELTALAEQAGAIIVGTLEQRLDRPVAGTYMGTGKVKELRALCDRLDASMVIFDHDLSPRQMANIEEVVERKIVDRSELILDIFASRATTIEAQLQVELAQLEYTYPRLRAMWDHLERIVGSGGMTGIGTRGPGEQQLEIDRRLAQRRRLALQARLAEVQARKRRMVAQRNVDHFTVGIVGYTNAGKSTLFNALTAGGAYADDRLFATLTTRTREWDVGGGLRVMLSDTVGFVRDLPHNLIASFRATLEEATHANLLLIVLDVSDPAAELHYKTVTETLDALFDEAEAAEKRDGVTPTGRRPERILLLNKVDRLRDNAALLVWQRTHPGCIAVCAREPGHPGVAEVAERVRAAAQGGELDLELDVELTDSRTIDTLEKRGRVVSRTYGPGSVRMKVRIGRRQFDQLRSLGARMKIVGDEADGRPGWRSPEPAPAKTRARAKR
ncbi:MAG: GTPase HflX [Phycisphaeraceae bacterium]|nr:GTPase HflX [Phycisphaeraceae bacterium]